MTSLTFYGGVNEIGGNKILLEDGEGRIFLDFGMSFDRANKYFSEFLQPKKHNGVIDFIEMGLLPKLPDMGGFYRGDYLAHSGSEVWDKPAYDAVFLTHAHADHSSYIHFLRREIPIYASEITKRILTTVEATSTSGFADFTRFKETFKLREKKRGEGVMRLKGEECQVKRDFRGIEKGQKIPIGNMTVEAIPVNHSLPGACGYIIHTTEGSVVYTGDLRFHGYGGEMTRKFIERAAEVKPVALLCEGTRIDETESLTEQDVQDRVAKVVERTKNLVIVNYPWKDTERMRSFYEVAKRTGRRLVISSKQANLLQQLEGANADVPSLDDDNLAIYIRRKGWGLITKSGYPDYIVKQDYEGWEQQFLSHPNRVTCEDIRDNQSDFIVRIDFFELTDLIDLKPAEDSCYIRSVTEPFDEESEIELHRVESWLRHFGLYPYHQIHASGHASGPELRQLIHAIKPKTVYPVHTKRPDLFQFAIPQGTELVIPEMGRKYPIRGV